MPWAHSWVKKTRVYTRKQGECKAKVKQARKECRAEILLIEERALSLQQALRAQYQDLLKKVYVCGGGGGRGRMYVDLLDA